VGGLLRQAVRELVGPATGSWGWATLIVNAVGAFALAALVGLLARRPSERVRLLVGTGLLGGLTTFSGFVVEAVLLVDAGRSAVAVVYVVVSVTTLLAAAVLGALVVRR
jgi:CrcB protein